jgi:hypothetical protein
MRTKIPAFKKSGCLNGMMLFQLDGRAKAEIIVANADTGCKCCGTFSRRNSRSYSPELISLE